MLQTHASLGAKDLIVAKSRLQGWRRCTYLSRWKLENCRLPYCLMFDLLAASCVLTYLPTLLTLSLATPPICNFSCYSDISQLGVLCAVVPGNLANWTGLPTKEVSWTWQHIGSIQITWRERKQLLPADGMTPLQLRLTIYTQHTVWDNTWSRSNSDWQWL